MAADTYMKIDGVPGDSTDEQHKEWIELVGFDHSFNQPASNTVASAGGGTVGRINMGHFSVSKRMDKASPKLYEYCCSGKHIGSITVDMMRASGDSRVKYMEIKMEDVVISSVNNSGHARSEDGYPIETLGLGFATVKWTYTHQNRSGGTAGGNVTGGWNLSANKTHA